MARKTGSQRRASRAAKREERNSATKTKRVTKGGKVFTVTSTDGGKSWTNPKPYTGKAGPFAMVKNPFKKSEKKDSKKSNLKITPAHDNPGAARAKAAAKARRDAGLNTVTGKKKGVKKKRKITTWRDME